MHSVVVDHSVVLSTKGHEIAGFVTASGAARYDVVEVDSFESAGKAEGLSVSVFHRDFTKSTASVMERQTVAFHPKEFIFSCISFCSFDA